MRWRLYRTVAGARARVAFSGSPFRDLRPARPAAARTLTDLAASSLITVQGERWRGRPPVLRQCGCPKRGSARPRAPYRHGPWARVRVEPMLISRTGQHRYAGRRSQCVAIFRPIFPALARERAVALPQLFRPGGENTYYRGISPPPSYKSYKSPAFRHGFPRSIYTFRLRCSQDFHLVFDCNSAAAAF